MKYLEIANREGIFNSDSVWFPTYYLLNIIWNTTDINHAIAYSYAENFVPWALTNLRHKPYLDNLQSVRSFYLECVFIDCYLFPFFHPEKCAVFGQVIHLYHIEYIVFT